MGTATIASMPAVAVERHGKPRNGTGFLITLALHGAIVGGIFWKHTHREEAHEAPRDFVVAEMVKLGKPREKFWLPRLPTRAPDRAPPPTIKITDDPFASAAPAEAPRPEDPEVSKEVKKALNRARLMAAAAGDEEPEEGLPTGSPDGTATTAKAGDAWATAMVAAIRKHWSVPTELVNDAALEKLEAMVRVQIAEDGTITSSALVQPSGNALYDDACASAVKATPKVPPPPPNMVARAAKGVGLVCGGKDLGK